MSPKQCSLAFDDVQAASRHGALSFSQEASGVNLRHTVLKQKVSSTGAEDFEEVVQVAGKFTVSF